MFKSLLKYTPLLRRCLVCFFAVLLLFSCFVGPLTAKAYISLDPAMAAFEAWLKASGFAYDAAEAFTNLFDDFIFKLQDLVESGVQKYVEFQHLMNSVKFGGTVSFTETDRMVFAEIICSMVNTRQYLNHHSVNMQDSTLTAYQIPVIGAGIEMYVPTEAAMQDVMSITQMQVLFTGFTNEQVELTKETHSILNQIRIFMGESDLLVREGISTFQKNVETRLRTINTTLTQRLSDIQNRLRLLDDNLTTRLADIRQELYTINSNITDRLSSIRTMQTTINNNLTDRLKSIRDMQSIINSNLEDRMITMNESINKELGNLKVSVQALPQSIADAIKEQFPTIQQTLDQVVEKIPAIEESLDQIIEKIPTYEDLEILEKPQIEVEIQGQEQILVSDYASMGNAFSAKMSWVTQIFDFLSELRSRLNSGTPPKVPIHLSAAEGSIDWGEDAYVLDMTWYARYKPSVDVIISGIMWLCFGWALYKRIPDILSGVGLTVENATEPRGHVWSDRADRAERKSRRGG